MRGLTRRWVMRRAPAVNALADLALPPLVQRVLLARGLGDPQSAQRFCEPNLKQLHDPSLLPGVDRAVDRLIHALRANQSIAIYGDYDVDGITATAILFHTIRTVQPEARLRTYVPHRIDEGYGINCEALRQLKVEGVDLVISVDCGITATMSAQTAHEIGLDLIITDHHNLPTDASNLPNAVAVVHPRLPGSRYPFGELCGAGVAFKLAWWFARRWCNSDRVSAALQQTLITMLPLAALGTIADVVPLVDENRVLTAFGLRYIKATPLVGLKALIDASSLMDEKIDSTKVGFILAPKLNACGRMGHASEAVRLLTEAGAEEAMVIARRLNDVNQHRQGVERHIFDHAVKMAEDAGMTGDACRAIVLAHESWHPGVVGIVCSRMVERFGRPTILLQKQRDQCRGSARSVEGYSIHDGIAAAAQHLISFGGHTMAAGLTLHSDQLQSFTDAVLAHANQCIGIDQLTPALTLDCDATLDELNLEAVQRLQTLAPFGRCNSAPTLRVRDAVIAESPKQIGSNGRHLALRVRQDAAGGGRSFMRAVWWSAGERAADFAPGMRVDLACEANLNQWNGRVNVEIEVRDIAVCQAQEPLMPPIHNAVVA